MIPHSPCELYVVYLVSHPARYTDDKIKEILAEKRLDDLGPDYLAHLRKKVLPPVPFRPTDQEHLPSQHFLNRHRIRTLYFPDQPTSLALQILEYPRLKEFVEAMLLVNAVPLLIARASGKIGAPVRVTEASVLRFKHFFWNTDLLDSTDMRALINRRGSQGDADYQRAYWKDSRRIAAELPFNAISAMSAQMQMGITPVGIDFADLMERVQIICGIKAYQHALDDGKFSSENTRNFMAAAQSATELLQRSHKAEELLLEKFNSLQMETDSTPIRHIRMLSEGNHTTDLQPVVTQDSVVDVEDEA